MTVYVDELRVFTSKPPFNKGSCHLMAADYSSEAIEELHKMAESIGLKRAWFQRSPPASWPHYDLTPGMRAKAIRAGAVFETELEYIARRRRVLDAIKAAGGASR